MQKVYIVMIQGWGDDENAMYNMGTFSTYAKAEAGLKKLIKGWVADGGNKYDVFYEIETHEVA
jgi:hypothetical protein